MTDGSYVKWDMPYFHITPSGDISCSITPGSDYFICDGKYISFDTTMNGKRQIAVIPTTALNF